MTSQEALYGPILTNNQQYRVDLQVERLLTREEEATLLKLVRQGDQRARTLLITRSLANYVLYWAGLYAHWYSWASAQLEYSDMVQEGNLMVLEMFDRALEKENPIGYLRACARYRIQSYCYRRAGLIVTPLGKDAYEIDSLDAPLPEMEDQTLADTLLADEEKQPEERDFTRLYQALEALTERQREVVIRHYGIECAPEDLLTISQSIARKQGTRASGAYSVLESALTRLRKKLADPTPEDSVPCACGCGKVISQMESSPKRQYYSQACVLRASRLRKKQKQAA